MSEWRGNSNIKASRADMCRRVGAHHAFGRQMSHTVDVYKVPRCLFRIRGSNALWLSHGSERTSLLVIQVLRSAFLSSLPPSRRIEKRKIEISIDISRIKSECTCVAGGRGTAARGAPRVLVAMCKSRLRLCQAVFVCRRTLDRPHALCV